MVALAFIRDGVVPDHVDVRHPPNMTRHQMIDSWLNSERSDLVKDLGSVSFALDADQAIKDIKVNNLIVEVRLSKGDAHCTVG